MKTKFLFLFQCLAFGFAGISTQAFADTLVCNPLKSEDPANIRINYGKISFSHVAYNFSTAAIHCVNGVQARINDEKPFKCVGIWSFDWILEDENDPTSRKAVDTVVEVDVNFDAAAGWQAHFISNHAYGRKSVDLACEIQKSVTP